MLLCRRDYQFTVTAMETDSVATATVFITVLDFNDIRPMFNSSSYQFSLTENSPAGTLVGMVLAYDGDSGINQEVG